MATDGMTSKDREELIKMVKLRAKVAKTDAKHRAADLLADFAQELATIRKISDARWKEITATAQAAVAEADAKIAALCRESGVPEDFRPSLSLGWSGRGENADGSRRVELKYVATTRCIALVKKAEAAIERSSVQIQTALVAGGLETDQARAFLESMPTAEQLMPALSMAEVETAVPLPQLESGTDMSDWQERRRIEDLASQTKKLMEQFLPSAS